METEAKHEIASYPAFDSLSDEITEWDIAAYEKITAAELTPEQAQRILQPSSIYPLQTALLAVHWHPENVPMPLIEKRLNTMFPNMESELVIPTQHNRIMTFNGFAGVEVDCYSPEFNRKVQLLLHFDENRVEDAHVLKSMLDHTFKYRSGQLFEYLDTILEPKYEERLSRAAQDTGSEEDLVAFTRTYARKLKTMMEQNYADTPPESIKNKLVMEYFDQLRERYGNKLINHVQVFLKAVKMLVKANFTLEYFFKTEEVIEEARSLGAGIVVPHPEQFWPILLANYDVDGYEVWNPQSREYTEFLIQVTLRQNRSRGDRKPLLIFMGDDTHMSEKAKPPHLQNHEKVAREVGFQAAWDDLTIRKSLITAGLDCRKIIEEYKNRLRG